MSIPNFLYASLTHLKPVYLPSSHLQPIDIKRLGSGEFRLERHDLGVGPELGVARRLGEVGWHLNAVRQRSLLHHEVRGAAHLTVLVGGHAAELARVLAVHLAYLQRRVTTGGGHLPTEHGTVGVGVSVSLCIL